MAVDLPGVAVFLTYEDESDEIARALHSMKAQKAVGDRFHYLAPPGPLWAPNPSGSGHTSTVGVLTEEGAKLRRYCEAYGARLLVIDPKAGAFGLNESDRALVRRFMADWDLWARATGCSILLISHPPKGDSDYSGSTDWHAASRAVWVLGAADTGTGEETGKGRGGKRAPAPAPRLQCIKSSYARRPASLWLSGYPDWKVASPEDAAREWAKVCSSDDGGSARNRGALLGLPAAVAAGVSGPSKEVFP